MIYLFLEKIRERVACARLECNMFKIKIADIVVSIENVYKYVEYVCKDYIYDGEECDFSVKSSVELINEERQKVSDENLFSDAFVENILIYRMICLNLLKYDAFVMHAAVIGVGDKAYAFTAKSGTGKSTHISLWKRLLGDKVYVINGDKPIMRFIGDKLFVYGTPWCGKEMWNTNVKAELANLCFLERGDVNEIESLSPGESVSLVMKQILIPKDSFGVIKTFDLVDKMLRRVALWKLKCNISLEAAVVAYEKMRGEQNEN